MPENLKSANMNGLLFLFCILLVSGPLGACTKPQSNTDDAAIKGREPAGRSDFDLVDRTGVADFQGAEVLCGQGQGVDDHRSNAQAGRDPNAAAYTNYRLAFPYPFKVEAREGFSAALQKLVQGTLRLPSMDQYLGLLVDLTVVVDTTYQSWADASRTCVSSSFGQPKKNCGGVYELPFQDIKIVAIPASLGLQRTGRSSGKDGGDPELAAAMKAAGDPTQPGPTAETVRRLMQKAIDEWSAPYIFLRAKPIFRLNPSPSLCQLDIDKITLSETKVVCSSLLPPSKKRETLPKSIAAGFVHVLGNSFLGGQGVDVAAKVKSYFGCGQAQL
jgi:hypothetical protein